MSDTRASEAVRNRRLFFIPGFDPRSPGVYHVLYRDESAKQAAALGGARTVSPAERVGSEAVAWDVEDASGCRTRCELLRWDDVVRAQWNHRLLPLLGDALPMYLAMVRRGVVWQCLRRYRGGLLAELYPAVLATLVAALALTAAWSMVHLLGGLAGALLAVVIAVAVLACGRPLLHWLKAGWVLRILVFFHQQTRGRIAPLEARLDTMAARVRAALDDPAVDEVLIAGHSVGAQLAVSVMARARALPAAPSARARPAILTMGQLIAYAVWWGRGGTLVRDLAAVAGDPAVAWLDVTDRPDPVCCTMSDPVAEAGLPAVGRPTRIVARFHRQFPPAVYRQLYRNKIRMHFQYLMAAELAGQFDWFAVSAGPRPLSAWIADKERPHVDAA